MNYSGACARPLNPAFNHGAPTDCRFGVGFASADFVHLVEGAVKAS